MACEHGFIYCILFIGRVKLYNDHPKYAYQRDEHDADAAYNMGVIFYRGFGSAFFSRFIIRRNFIIV